jgi:glycosyltransferase involved in cell wall biosynthesis
MRPRVAIGLPVKNGGVLLRPAIESILAQQYADFELLIADNDATDETADLCAAYAKLDRRVRVFRHAEDIGAIGNFEYVLAHTTGELFMWSAHDDLKKIGYGAAPPAAVWGFIRDAWRMGSIRGLPPAVRAKLVGVFLGAVTDGGAALHQYLRLVNAAGLRAAAAQWNVPLLLSLPTERCVLSIPGRSR